MKQDNKKLPVMDGNAAASCGIDAAVLLAGGLRPSPLVRETGVSVLDLPLRSDMTVLDRWVGLLVDTAVQTKHTPESVVVAYSANSPQPDLPDNVNGLPSIRFMCDQTGLRGPAGTVRDLCRHLDDDATIFLAEAARYFTGDIHRFLRLHVESGADITVGRNRNGSPAGLYLTTKRMIDLVPEEGFMDLKEQWLSKAVGVGKMVYVVSFDEEAGLPLRTWEQYLNGIRRAGYSVESERSNELIVPRLRFSERFGKNLTGVSIIMPNARIADSARIVDSVVMPDAVVNEHAVVVRSFIGAGTHIASGQVIVDGMIPAVEHGDEKKE